MDRRKKSGDQAPYHHGALRSALIEATESLLAQRGLEGYTLREAARQVGVSPAAALHHFGSVAGLLTEVAILGFEELARFLHEGGQAGDTPTARLHGKGIGYVRFALAYPARFLLMFRKDLLAPQPRLELAGRAAYAELEEGVRDYLGRRSVEDLGPSDQALLLGAWSTVHGFAHLALEGKFGPPQADPSTFVKQVLPEMLKRLFPAPSPRKRPRAH
ncbi:MAG: TetR/AcrR family transcriptional regulator [Pigmentiphaga sp.]|uniref:TetR/AcrR family transcriptional regulator n=1 Tax=Pigmentiphaga sp. TaxID=1977564 RepID=UPI0029A0696C|nr:TetR/AcrR family transcriptional regulator [Pigmentiphaga sp.]MDX3907224.1 TetR/AcrR family transcriptional regulator [Pigmentiphaga sp.]